MHHACFQLCLQNYTTKDELTPHSSDSGLQLNMKILSIDYFSNKREITIILLANNFYNLLLPFYNYC